MKKSRKNNDEPPMADKIIRALLNLKFPSVPIDTLMKIINSTPDSVRATEMLTGLYQKPIIESFPCDKFVQNNKRKVGFAVISFDEWSDEVHYQYNSVPYKIVWLPTSYKEDLPTYEEVNHSKNEDFITGHWYEDAADEYGVKNGMNEEERKNLRDARSNYTEHCIYGEVSEGTHHASTHIDNWQEEVTFEKDFEMCA
jgi:hypothetical protein